MNDRDPIKIQITSENDETLSFSDSVKKMRGELKNIIEFQKLQAKTKREYYLALVGQGFDPIQALELIK